MVKQDKMAQTRVVGRRLFNYECKSENTNWRDFMKRGFVEAFL
jgi:hypothetical protein